MSEKIEASAEPFQQRLVEALRECRDQLDAAHVHLVGDRDVGCDGTCSYAAAIQTADKLLAEAGAQ